MKNTLTSEQLGLFAQEYDRELADQLAATDPRSLGPCIPETWLNLVEHPTADSVTALWADAESALPRFVDYLRCSVNGAAILNAYGFPILILALPNWKEEDFNLMPGFCWMGLPTAPEAIDRFVDQVGPIPAALDKLWRVTNFITMKEHSLVCSLDESTRQITEAPVALPPLVDPNAPSELYECLQIAVINDQMVTCMTRPPGQHHWNDFIVRRFRRANSITSAVRVRLDDKLADWTFVDWEP